MLGQIVVLAGGALAALAILGAIFVLGMRAKSPLVLRAVTGFAKRFVNPRQMKTAGARGASTSVVRHTGRKSGQAYATPVDVVPVDGAFLVALPYGSRTNWLRNVLAGGSATVVHDGVAYRVDRPEVVPMAEVAAHFSPGDRRSFRLMQVDECLRVRTVGVLPAAAAETAAVA